MKNNDEYPDGALVIDSFFKYHRHKKYFLPLIGIFFILYLSLFLLETSINVTLPIKAYKHNMDGRTKNSELENPIQVLIPNDLLQYMHSEKEVFISALSSGLPVFLSKAVIVGIDTKLPENQDFARLIIAKSVHNGKIEYFTKEILDSGDISVKIKHLNVRLSKLPALMQSAINGEIYINR